MAEALQSLALAPAQPYEGSWAWRVAIDDDAHLDVEYDDNRHGFVISAGIGQAAQAARPALYETLLQYNFVWSHNGGVRMALEAATGQIVVIADVPDRDLTALQLATALSNMGRLKHAWAEIVRGWAAPAGDSAQALVGAMRA